MLGAIVGGVIGGGIGLIVGGALAGGSVRHEGRRMTIETGSARIQLKWAVILALIGALIGGLGSALIP